MKNPDVSALPSLGPITWRARLSGLNLVGLKRRGFSKDEIKSLRVAYRQLFAEEGLLSERIEDVAGQFSEVEVIMEIVEFMRA